MFLEAGQDPALARLNLPANFRCFILMAGLGTELLDIGLTGLFPMAP
jgi:hypothetical protein